MPHALKDYLYNNERNPLFRTDYRPTEYKIPQARLHINLDPTKTIVTSTIDVKRNPDLSNAGGALILDGENMKLVSLKINENGHLRDLDLQEYFVTDKNLVIKNPPSAAFQLEIVTEINPEANTQLSGIYKSGNLICSQCESQGFRRITYFLDRPDNLAIFNVTLEADKKDFPLMLSNGNGNPHVTRDLGNGRHEITWSDPWPKPSYLFAAVAGDMKFIEDKFVTMSGKEVDLRIFVDPGYEGKISWAMQSIKRAMKWDEVTYGREYDLDCFHIVAVSDFNFGAMENKGLNIYNISALVGNPETSTDARLTFIEAVIGHEYFHNWTGDRVTLRDWFELTLKEGLTVLRDRQFTADTHSAAIKTIDDAMDMRTIQFKEDEGPTSHPIRPDRVEEFENIYSGTVYEKGSHVLGMLKTLIGAETWRAATDEYFSRFDGQAVTCDDFINVMQDVSGRDLTQFRRWYSQSGTPEISYEGKYDASAKTYTLTLTQETPATADQSQNEKRPLHIPVAVGLIAESGKDVPGSNRILELTDSKQSFIFENVTGPVVPSVLRGFSAPVKIVTEPSDDELLFRMAHDSDPYNKYEATERLMIKNIIKLIDDYQNKRDMKLNPQFASAFASNVANALDGDMSFSALTLDLPAYDLIAQRMNPVDPDAIIDTMKFVRKSLAEQFKTEFMNIYHETQAPTGEAYDVIPAQVGRRALHNSALSYLATLKTPEVTAMCRQQYDTATNMTERLQALTIISNGDDKLNAAVTRHDFYERFKNDTNVVDTWLRVSASAKTSTPVAQAQKLMEHPAFVKKNPNKVRALVGGFASNIKAFHNKDGSGYAFVADTIIEMNSINPKTGARLAALLTDFKRYDQERQNLMLREMARIMETPNLDVSIKEIIGKALDTSKPAAGDPKPGPTAAPGQKA